MPQRQWPGVFLCSARSPFRDGGGQLPLAEITGVSNDLKRLSAGRGRKDAQHDRQKECFHDLLPCPRRAPQCFCRNACASATSVLALSAALAISTTFL